MGQDILPFRGDDAKRQRGCPMKNSGFSTFFHFFEKKSDFFISLAPGVFNIEFVSAITNIKSGINFCLTALETL
jgi:hypothetical protein